MNPRDPSGLSRLMDTTTTTTTGESRVYSQEKKKKQPTNRRGILDARRTRRGVFLYRVRLCRQRHPSINQLCTRVPFQNPLMG
jgi:hypothetical protein